MRLPPLTVSTAEVTSRVSGADNQASAPPLQWTEMTAKSAAAIKTVPEFIYFLKRDNLYADVAA